MRLHLVILSSPSGAGKSTLSGMLIEDPGLPGYRFSVSHTTREPRGSEKHGKDYWFVTEAEFEGIRSAGGFAESATVHGHRYGTSIREIDRISAMEGSRGIVFDVDWQGARGIKGRFSEALTVFVLPPGLEALRRRLTGRGTDDPGVIEARMGNAAREIAHHREFDHVIVNDDLGAAYAELRSLVVAHRDGAAIDRREREAAGRRLAAEMIAGNEAR